MNVYLVTCVLLNLVILINGQNKTKECKLNKDADTCLMHLLLLGDPKFKFPVNKAEMSTHCRSITGHEKCIKDYSSKCLATFPRQVTSVLAYGVAKTNKGYCANKRRKDSFISMGACANNVKPDGDICMRQFIDNLQGVENHKDVNLRIPLVCCNFYRMKTCILKVVEGRGSEVCPESSFNEIERIIDGYAIEVLNLVCGDYTEDSDKCEKIIAKTPKKLSSQKKPRSMLPPFINIMSSVPQ